MIYEYYDENNGKGLGGTNFGWSSLITLIIDEKYF